MREGQARAKGYLGTTVGRGGMDRRGGRAFETAGAKWVMQRQCKAMQGRQGVTAFLSGTTGKAVGKVCRACALELNKTDENGVVFSFDAQADIVAKTTTTTTTTW